MEQVVDTQTLSEIFASCERCPNPRTWHMDPTCPQACYHHDIFLPRYPNLRGIDLVLGDPNGNLTYQPCTVCNVIIKQVL